MCIDSIMLVHKRKVVYDMPELSEKWKEDELQFNQLSNAGLCCKDCVYALDDTDMPCNTSKCKKFDIKPDEVLSGGECIEYKASN